MLYILWLLTLTFGVHRELWNAWRGRGPGWPSSAPSFDRLLSMHAMAGVCTLFFFSVLYGIGRMAGLDVPAVGIALVATWCLTTVPNGPLSRA